MGRPGSGKTLLCTILFLKAVAKGLNCSITCLSGERAQQLGGEHIHKMFKFRVPKKNALPDLMASQSITSLLKDVTRMTDLERLDVLFIDEIGQVNSELFTAMEIVLQNIRDNRLPMCGVLTIMTGDPKQLKPPDGSLIWLSPKMLTNFDFYYFQHYVRATPGLSRSILEQLDKTEISEIEAYETAKVISANCNIKSTWEDATDSFCIKVFSTRAAEQEAVVQHPNKIQSKSDLVSVIVSASDEESSTGSSNRLPTSTQNSFIDRNSITPKNILLYHGALMRFTANLKQIRARQGQFCILLEIPSDFTTQLEVLVAPPGCRYPSSFDKASLIQCGWRKAIVSKTYTPVINNQTTFLRRDFFPLKNYVASTIHKCLGDTFPKIITKISLTDCNYEIWEKEQLLVLLSRVRKMEEITFVGNKVDIENTLTTAIQKKSCWSEFINNFLSKISCSQGSHSSTTLDVLSTQFQPLNIVLLEGETGFVYLLLSTKIPIFFYFGETVDIRKRLREHNTGYGPIATSPIERRPFAVYAFITGFTTHNLSSNQDQRKRLESVIQYKTSLLSANLTASDVFRVFEENCNNFALENELNLKIILCGKAP